MTPQRWRELDELLDEVLRGERDRDDALASRDLAAEERRMLVRILAQLEGADGDFLEDGALAWLTPPGDPAAPAGGARSPEADDEDLAAGARVGAYRILRRLGRGGMGSVFLAARADDEYQREVAIKVSRADASPAIRERFRAERQILASLDHPAVAGLLDGGTLDDGRPYLVMERVVGEPITAYCERRRLDVRQRLELFARVLEGIAHAHRQLVVHRDLKPANILVDEEGRPRVVDFGIAEPVAADAGTETAAPHPRAPHVTPAYASPGQLLGEPVSTRDDVYSLGVLLHELLTGRLPFPAPATSVLGALYRLRVRPEPPSAALTGRRRRRLAGDLDAIVLCALDPDAEHRYGSVEQLADDLRRHLAARPVAARNGGWSYYLGRALRRHAVAVGGGALAIVLLAAIAILSTLQSARLGEALAAANAARETSDSATDFLVASFDLDTEEAGRGGEVTAAELLARARDRVARELAAQPLLAADLLDTIAASYRGLGLFEPAREALVAAVGHRRRAAARGEGSAGELIASLDLLADVEVDRGAFDAAAAPAREALARRRRLYGERDVALAAGFDRLAFVSRRAGRLAAAEEAARTSLTLRTAALGDDHPAVADSLRELVEVLTETGPYDEAVRLARRALELRDGAGDEPDVAMARTVNNLATALMNQGQLGEAEALYLESMAIVRQVHGEAHPDVATTVNNLALLRHMGGHYAEAVERYREALTLYRRFLAPDHPLVVNTLGNLAGALGQLGRRDEAVDLYRQALGRADHALPSGHPRHCSLRHGLAYELARARDDAAEAETVYRQALALCRESLGERHADTASILVNLADLLTLRGRAEEADALAEEARAVFAETLPPGHWRRAVADSVLGAALVGAGRREEGLALLTESHRALVEERGEAADETRLAAARLARAATV